MKKAFLALAIVTGLTSFTGSAKADSVTYYNPQSGTVSSFGSVGAATETYGVTFYAPGSSFASLNDFTFNWSGSSTIAYQADVYAWSGTQATGSSLFSHNTSMTGNGNFQAVTTTTGGVTLTSGMQYVAFFTTSDPTSITNQGSAVGAWAFGTASTLLPSGEGGQFVFYNNSTQNLLTTSTWDSIGYSYSWNAAFTANFTTTAVPEPSTNALLGLGALVLVFATRTKRRRA